MKAIIASLCLLWTPLLASAQDNLPRVQGARMADRLVPDAAFELNLFANRLGKVSDMALAPDGTLYSLDLDTGRVFILRDRGMDGRMDMRRALPVRFSNPDAISISDERIFISDDSAVWELVDGLSKRKIASLEQANAKGRKYLASGNIPNALIVGLTSNGISKLIQIDILTGRAALLEEASGSLNGLTQLPDGRIWTMRKTDAGTQIGIGLRDLGSPVKETLSQITILDRQLVKSDRLEAMSDHLIAVEDGTKLSAYPVSLGQIQTPGRVLLQGFKIKNRATAWGQISAVLSDERGIFIADGTNGDIWRLSPARPIPDSTPSPASSDDSAPDP